MKKTMFAVICLAMTTITCVAKHNDKAPNPQGNQPRHEMKHQPRIQPADPVIDMEIVSQMGLSPKEMKKIEALQQQKQHEMMAMLPKPKDHKEAKPCPKHEDKKVDKKAPHGEHYAQMKAINEKYRREMQEIMGTKTYVRYVEKVNDKLAMHHGPKFHQKKGEKPGQNGPKVQQHHGEKANRS